MKASVTIVLIFIALLINSCNTGTENITASDIKILKTNKHPFLVDHEKKLVVTLNDQSTNEVVMYLDTGSGCNSNLFEDEEYFILIECNGQEYLIEKSTGEIIQGDWKWLSPLPNNYVHTYVRSRQDEYETAQLEINLMDVYKYKDPRK